MFVCLFIYNVSAVYSVLHINSSSSIWSPSLKNENNLAMKNCDSITENGTLETSDYESESKEEMLFQFMLWFNLTCQLKNCLQIPPTQLKKQMTDYDQD